MSRFDELERLADLRDRGVLSQVEFEAQKAKILSPHPEPSDQTELSSRSGTSRTWQPAREDAGIASIVQSRVAMALAAAAAGLYTLGSLLALLAFATLTSSSVSTFTNLGHASNWLHFAGTIFALLALCVVVRNALISQQLLPLVEVAGASVATLLVAIGALVFAASSSSTSTGGILLAIGIGLWGLVAMSRGARITMDQSAESNVNLRAGYWIGASVGLIILCVGAGFVYDPSSKGSSIASGALQALGIAVLACALLMARIAGFLKGRTTPVLTTGLAIVVAFFVGTAVVAGIEFSNPTLTGLRLSFSIVYAIGVMGFATLALAAWTQSERLGAATAPQLR
jgi:hypothetical protein